MKNYNTDNMKYVIIMAGQKSEYDFMSDLYARAKKEDDDGNGFSCFIHHTDESGKIESIPFVF